MDGLFEFLPIIAVIVFGIIRAMAGAKEQEQQQKKPNRPNVPGPSTAPSEGQNNPKRTVYRSSDSEVYKESEPKQRTSKQTVYTSTPTNVFEEEQQKQVERLKKRMNTGTSDPIDSLSDQDLSIGPTIQDAIKHHSLQDQNVKKERFKKDVKSGLNYKGLVNGIIMSEVLGSPRARKPYQSVTAERRRKIQYK